MHSIDKSARKAGALYLVVALTAPFSEIYIPGKLVVHADATATANNILAHETLFRFGIVTGLCTAGVFICVGMALYQLLSGVNKAWARLMIAFVLVSVAVGFLNELNNIAALILFRGGEFLAVLDKTQRDALGMFFLRLQSHGEYINEIFWGLWLLPFGMLVFRSRFLPRFLGVWLILNCFAYLALSVTALMFPVRYGIVFSLAMPLLFGELAIILWLLIKGAKVPLSAVTADGQI
jgi:hypothetical protein